MFADQRALGARAALAAQARRAPARFWGGCIVLLACALALLLVGYLGWALALCGVVILVLVAPQVLLVLLPPAVAFGSLFSLALGGLSAGPTDLLVAGLVVALAWHAARERERIGERIAFARQRSRAALVALAARWPVLVALLVAVALYLAAILLSALVATSRVAVAKEALKWGEVLVVIAAAWWFLWRRPEWLARVLWSVVAAGLAQALLGYAQWALGAGDLGPGGDTIRVFGTFGQPNPYAADLNLALLPAIAGALFGADARARWVLGSAAVLIFGAQVLADSRGALLALIVAVAVMLVLALRLERPAALAVLVGVPLLALAWVTHVIPARLQDRLLAQVRLGDVSLGGQVNDANYSTVERLAHWVAGLRMFAAHPLLGVGAGNYDAAYARYALPNWPESLGHAHNYYINAAAETGIIGVLAFLAVVGAALFAAWRATHSAVVSPLSHMAGEGDDQAPSPVGTDTRAPERREESRESGTEQPRRRATASARRSGRDSEGAGGGRGLESPGDESIPPTGGPLVVGARAWALGCAAVVVAVLVHSLVDDLFVHAMALQFGLVLGILAVCAEGMPPAVAWVTRPPRPATREAERP